MPPKPYAALVIDTPSRNAILERFPARYPRIVAHHLTILYGTHDPAVLFTPDTVDIIGHCSDNTGIEALLCRVNGHLFRDDGHPWHITLSINPDLEAPDFLKPYELRITDPQLANNAPAKYAPAMSNPLLRRGLNPDYPDIAIDYIEHPLKIAVRPEIIVPKNMVPRQDTTKQPPCPD